ncbi:Nitrilase family, member 2 [Seminavis robusta]|uniref:Nitrilase family, member 2 n=1 Tax=Seminavis robusta TaxID=568900 RepID=A0A9N8F279_9STRA|nr:Nitrilase family, member 2 [Seminavis robusta]|eukprot:Sro2672_g334320.1 Nitrilase family, member 2 (338) ;mRNA; f:6031-7044
MHYMKRPRESEEPKLLPLDFLVGPNMVMIGRGRRCLQNEGNRKFRAMVKAELQAYSVGRKAKKSSIIKRILREIRNNCADGIGFIKQDAMTGRYYTATTTAAKVTIAQAFRDALNDTIGYKSSKQHKQFKRDVARGKIDPDCIVTKADEIGVCSSCKEELQPGTGGVLGSPTHDASPKPVSAEPSLHFWKDDMGPIVEACEGDFPVWPAESEDLSEAIPLIHDKGVTLNETLEPELEPMPPLKKKDVDPFEPLPLDEALTALSGALRGTRHQFECDHWEHSYNPPRVALVTDDDDEDDHEMVAWASEFVSCPLCSLVQGRGDFEELPIADIRKELVG